jgi:hypothetical protein
VIDSYHGDGSATEYDAVAMRCSFAVLVSTVALAACRPSHDATSDPHRETVSIAPPADATAAVVDAGVDAARLFTDTDSPGAIGYVADGTLLAFGSRALLARSRTGAVARYSLPEGATIQIASDLRGVVVRTETHATLLATPRLEVLYDGTGTPLDISTNVLAVQDRHVLLFQKGAELARLPLPSTVPLEEARGLRLVANETRANVSFHHDTDNGPVYSAVLYDLATGGRIGRGVSLESDYSQPSTALLDTVAYFVEGKRVSRVDLRTGAVVRKGTVVCGAETPVGNPTPSPDGALLLVTCGNDAVVLDGATLVSRRRIRDVVPGCDNGPILGGDILKDGHTLRLDGCGGEAKLDLGTGKYACADDPGLLGAPYGAGMPIPGGQRLPKGREHVGRCTSVETPTTRLGASERYRLDHSNVLAVTFDGGSIPLPDAVGDPVLAPDESEFAYLRGDRVVVIGLPKGKAITELSLIAGGESRDGP